MELDPRTADGLPFREVDEPAAAYAGAPEPVGDVHLRHLQRVRLFLPRQDGIRAILQGPKPT